MKKKILACLVMLVLFVTLAVAASAAPTQLSTAEDILKLMNGVHSRSGDYVLTNDIDLSDYDYTAAGAYKQQPIGKVGAAFLGTFDGAGYTISGINISATAAGAGFFGSVDAAANDPAIIKNLTISGTITSTTTDVGGLVGRAGTSTNANVQILNCTNYCTVKGDNAYVGGLVGRVYNTTKDGVTVTLDGCVNYGTITGVKHTGGMIGRIENTKNQANVFGTVNVLNCANFGTITNSGGDAAGGILGVGMLYHTALTVDGCYNGGDVTGQNRVGGIVGVVYCHAPSTVTVKNSINTATVTGTSQATGCAGGIMGAVADNKGTTDTFSAGTTTILGNFNSGAVVLSNSSTDVATSGAILGGYYKTNIAVADLQAATTLTDNCYAAGTSLESGCNTYGNPAVIAKADLDDQSKYPAMIANNADTTWAFSANGPILAAVHEHIYELDGTDVVCTVGGEVITSLTTATIDGETWIQLDSAADVFMLMANSQAGNKAALGYNYILMEDVTLSGGLQYPIGQPEASATSPTNKAPFTGKFDGNNKTVSGLNLTGSMAGYGFFGTVGGGLTGGDEVAVIKNLTVEGKVSSTAASSFVGGVVGLVFGNAEIDNCVNNCTVTGVSRIGGVVGAVVYNVTAYDDYTYTATIKNCINNGAIEASTTGEARIGGVVGQVSMGSRAGCVGTIENCTNNGDITAQGNYVGGITSRLEPNGSEVSAINCVNSATATVTGKSYVGGIAGITYYSTATTSEGIATVSRCVNYGTVEGTSLIGGVIGYAYGGYSATYVQECLNVGSVSGTYRIGGIAGYTQTSTNTTVNAFLEDCVNIGAVTATGNAGTAEVSGISAIVNRASISGCINAGTITGTGKYIAGIASNSASTAPYTDCISMGTLVSNMEGATGVYAIVGNKQTGYSISNCYYMEGTTAENTAANAAKLTPAEAKAALMTWCIWHGLNADAEDVNKSTHTFGEDNKCIVCGAEPHANHKDSVEFFEDEERRDPPNCQGKTGTAYMVCPTCYVVHTETLQANHVLAWDLDTLTYGCATCDSTDDSTQSGYINGYIAPADVIANCATIYVSDDGKTDANGLSADAALDSFSMAMDLAAKIGNAAGRDMTVKIVGKATLAPRQLAGNTLATSFEETQHTNKITITSSNAEENDEFAFAADCSAYALYGPTVFENLNISAANEAGTYLFARGFKLVMGEGLVMLGEPVEGTTYSWEDGFLSATGEAAISTVKLYVYGGFHSNAKYDGCDASTYAPEMEILSGDYWLIASFNRGMATTAVTSSNSKITIGEIEARYLIPTTNYGGDFSNTTIDIHYIGKSTIGEIYRSHYNSTGTGENVRVNHFVHKAADLLVRDSVLGSNTNAKTVGFYYATSQAETLFVNGFITKGNAYEADYNETNEVLTFPQWCLKYGVNGDGEHDYVNGICSFCGLAPCDGTHYYLWDLETLSAVCSGCGDTIDASMYTAVYVSETGREGAAGTAADPLKRYAMAQALTAAIGNAKQREMTLCLTGNIDLPAVQISNVNMSRISFEETKHDYPITITSADVNNKGTLRFTNDAYYYFLYGDTKFENMQFGALDRVGTSSSSSPASNIFARGFSLTMGTGLEMLSNSADISLSKTNAGVTGLGATVKIPDVKLYIFGGFQSTGYYDGDAGKNQTAARTADSNLTILSGKYWTIAGANRGSGLNTYSNKTVNITLGEVEAAYICPLTSDTANAVENVTVNIYYTDTYTAAYDYRFFFNTGSYGVGGTVNRFYYKDAVGSLVGDFATGNSDAAASENAININANMYYATEMQGEKVITGYTEKHERYAEVAHQTGDILPFPEWCLKYGVNGDGKHNFVEGACSFCDVKACDGTNHYIVWDLSGTTAVGTCTAGCADYKIQIKNQTRLYVSDNGRVGATGLTASDPLHSFTLAMDLAAKAGKNFTVQLVGEVTPTVRQIDTTANTFTNSFEESQHTNTITITSTRSGGVNAGTLHFTNACRRYFMYGPTTFQNIDISCDVTSGIYLIARGHAVKMGTGLKMVDVNGKTESSKTDAGIAGLGATVYTSDVKVYLYGGFYAETATDDDGVTYVANKGLYPGADPESYDANVTVLSGEYWTVCGLNRGFLDTLTMHDTTVTMTLGGITAYVVSPTTTDAAVLNNVTARVDYTGKVNTAFTYRFSYSGNSTSGENAENKVEHFFYKGYNGSVVGDFGVGSSAVPVDVNMYYATALETNDVINGYKIKDERHAAAYQQTTEIMSFPEWCTTYGVNGDGKHVYDANGKCTFCEGMQCTTHPDTEWVVTLPATCVATGTEVRRCVACFEAVETKEIPLDPNAHETVWESTAEAAICKCTLCGEVIATQSYANYAEAEALYVSANATGDGLSAASPIGDFRVAMELAAQSEKDVTIYILDIATIPNNGPVATYVDYIEPAHDNLITITSVSGTSGVLRFDNANANSAMVMVYNLSGPTKFENIELSSWGAIARMNIAARHHKLTFGEGVTCDWQRGDNSSHATSDLIILGGCYGSSLCDGEYCCVDENGDARGTDMTLLSGNVGAVIGGGYLSGGCCTPAGETGAIRLTLGDISVRRDVTAGSYGDSSRSANVGDIIITIVGNVSVSESFMFGSYGASYKAEDVTIFLLDGSIVSGTFQAINTEMPIHVLGQSAAGETPLDRVNTVTVFTDPSNPKAMAMYEHVRDALASVDSSIATDPVTGELRYKFGWMDSYCEVSNGTHAHAEGAEPKSVEIDPTCLSEGLAVYDCTHCGTEYKEAIPALGHKFTDEEGNPVGKLEIPATCIAPAMTKQTCTTCGASVYEIVEGSEPLDGTLYAHHYDPDKTGYCQICNKDVTALCEHKILTGENAGDSALQSNPITSGCATGTRTVCSECGMVEVELNSVGDGHNFGKYTVTKEPTATEAGVKTRVCKGCGKTETALINASGDLAGFDIEASKLSKVEKAALNALLQQRAYGSEVKISYETDGDTITGVTYNIPVPAEYTEYKNVMVVIKDDEGNLHFVDFAVEKGYIVFTF